MYLMESRDLSQLKSAPERYFGLVAKLDGIAN